MQQLTKKYGLITAIAMVVGIVVGSGVFFKAQVILKNTGGNLAVGVAAWIIGGAIMILCMLAFATMATRYEKVNGVVDYAEATCGGRYAYYLGWFMTTIYYPTLTSALAWLSARYTCVVFGFENPVTGPECMAITLFYLVLSFTVNALSPKLAGKFQISATAIKMIPLVLMAIVGTVVGLVNGQLGTNFAYYANQTEHAVSVSGGLFAGVVATAFAYEGWIIATSINAELKDAKRNLPIALMLGGVIIVAIYLFYYIGVAGGAAMDDLMDANKGAPTAFTNIFGNVFGTILNVFVAVSCLGTLNGLMLGCCRGLYSVSARNQGPSHEVFNELDERTNMPTNSSIIGLVLCAAWFLFFYGSQLAGWFGSSMFAFDSTELPIVTIYALYIPIFILMMIKEKNLPTSKRFVIPCLATAGSVFMIFAACWSHKLCVVGYLIIFAVIMAIGALFYRDANGKSVLQNLLKQ